MFSETVLYKAMYSETVLYKAMYSETVLHKAMHSEIVLRKAMHSETVQHRAVRTYITMCIPCRVHIQYREYIPYTHMHYSVHLILMYRQYHRACSTGSPEDGHTSVCCRSF